MRKILQIYLPVFVLLMALCYSSAGYFVVYKSMQYAVKKEVKRKLKLSVPKSSLHLLKISVQTEKTAPAEVFIRIHEGEFRYYGEMYDIVYKENKGDTTYYYCIQDKEEKILFAQLEQDISSFICNNQEPRKKQETLVKQLIREYLPPASNISFVNFKWLHIFKPLLATSYISFISIATPPPKN